MANVFVNPGWNNTDNPITVYILNGYVYKTDPGTGSSTALCYNKLGAENNNDMKGAVSAASNGDTIYVYNDSSDSLSLSTPSGTYCPPGLYELYLNSSTTSQKNLAVWANKLQLGENNSYIKLGDNNISISMDFHVSDSFVVGSGKSFSVLNGSSFSISKIEQGGNNSVSFTNNGSIDVSNSTFAADTVETSANTASFLVRGTSTLNIGTLNGTIKTLFATTTTLNASSITGDETNGGTISAQNDLTFTGANTLNGVTLDATGKTVTVGTGNSDSLTVGGTSTLNIGTLDGTIKTGSAGTTLTGSDINGGTITALGNLTFAGTNVLQDVTFNATAEEKNVTVDTSLWVKGTSTLNIGTLNGVIRTNVATTFSNSTISGGDGGLYIYENTPVIFAGENQVNAAYWWTTPGHYSSIINNGLITVKSIPASGDNPNALDYVPAQRGVLKAIDIWNSGSITAGSADAENADACSIEVTNLTNNNSLTVTCNAELANPSRLKATQGIVNNGMMTLTNSELNAKTLTNNGSGISQSTAGMTISNSTVSASGENPLVITNGNSNTFATIEINNSMVTAGQVTNFSFHNGQDPTWGTWGLVVTNQSFFSVTDLSNTGWIQVTDSTLSATSVYIGEIDNERNYSGKLQVNGTSTLDIASLEGTITIGSGYFPDPITLKDSGIIGKVDNGDRLGNISVTNPLTFNGANTLTNISLATINYGAVTVGDSDPEADSLTLTNSTVGCTVKVQSGATLTLDGMNTITTLDLSEASEGSVTMDWQDKLSFTGFSGDYKGKLTINLNSFTAGDLSTPILDYTGSPEGKWTEDNYKALLTNAWSSSDPNSTQYTFRVSDDGDLYLDLQEIVVNGGTYDDPTAFEGVSAIVQNGDFNHSVSGGCQLTDPESPLTGDITMSVENGSFEKMVNPGDYVLSGSVTRNCSELALTANGGTFENYLVGGMAYVSTEMDGFAKLIGDINLTVKGGTFERYIYGGSIAKTKLVSALTEIHGDISILVDADEANISMKQLICGSYNLGKVFGDITLTLSGSGSNLHFVDGGEIWGGNGAEYHDATGTLVTNMDGWVVHSRSNEEGDHVTTRTLSFTGFQGALDCPKIRAFSDIEFIGNTNVILSENTVDLSEVEFWKIEYNADAAASSSLKGDFANNFTGDTLTLDMAALAGDLPENWSWTILENSREGAFAGFGEEGLEVYLKNGDSSTRMSWDSTYNRYCSNDNEYYLALNDMDSPTKMMLTTTLA